jgi:putative CocE/NonD family hydrolase
VTVLSQILARRLRLPRPQSTAVAVDRDLRVAMADGAVLLADRYAPPSAGPMPTVLVRTPYGRRGLFGLLHGRLFAERGLQVVVQSARGTFGSEGRFSAYEEREDGLATIAWIQSQPWHFGRIGMTGMSYLGQVQWAVAGAAGDALGALAPAVSSSWFHGASYGGGMALESAASWLYQVSVQAERFHYLRMLQGVRNVPAVLNHLPLSELDAQLFGEPQEFWQRTLEHSAPDSPYWASRDFSAGIARVSAPMQLMAGWWDLFTPWQLEDFVRLRRAGKEAQLIVGPWAHTSDGLVAANTRESLEWMRAHLLGDRRRLHETPVRIHVGGADEWRDLDDWPPQDARELRLYLQPGRSLGANPPGPAHADRYRYDPSDPTPSLGGPVLFGRKPVVDNAPLEARADVLTYTTAPISRPVEAIGPVHADIHIRSSLEYFDVFVRVCDVDAVGTSRNVCDALERVEPSTAAVDSHGVSRVRVALWPTAHRFAAGHRIRVQVSSGAHPRYARNLGTGEPLLHGTRMVAANQEVFHDPEHPSSVTLSVVGAAP